MTIIKPAVETLRADGINAVGPLAADTLFHPQARAGYDAALCMFHDQALIPVKTLAFDRGVNVTLGLPFIRTSPDHGTAFDIAGTGRADPGSLIEALRLAARLAAQSATASKARLMSAIDDLPPLRDVIRKHDLAAKKSLGQNFLLDLNLTARIARAAGPYDDVTIVEIGPGPGGLTRALAGAWRTACDRDRARQPRDRGIGRDFGALSGRLTVIEDDALTFDPRPLLHGQRARIVANLPYNIATPLLISWLTTEPWPPWYDRMVLMFQREVAERIVAAPGSKTYGRLSVLTQWRTVPKMLFDISPKAFMPPPKVTSSLVEFFPRAEPLACDRHALEKVTEAAFGQRRKMLRQSLKTLGGDPAPLLDEAGIAGTARAEEIPVEGFVRLARLHAAGAKT